jgi:hypothetical protein
MKPQLLLVLCATLSAPALQAADGTDAPVSKKAGNQAKAIKRALPDAIPGISDADYAKIKSALIATYQDISVAAARKHLADVRERSKFTSGRNEQEDLRKDAEAAVEAMHKSVIDAALKFDPSLTKDNLVVVLNALEAKQRQLNQEAAQKAAAERKAAAEAKAKTQEPKADGKSEKPAPLENPQIALLADVDGVSKADMAKFRAVAGKMRQDPDVVAARNTLAELKKRAEYASDNDKKDLRGDFEAAMSDMRKANVNAILKADPSLSKDIAETIVDAVADRLKAVARKGARKSPVK